MPVDAAAVRTRLQPGDLRRLLTTARDENAPEALRRHAEQLLASLAEDAAERRTAASAAPEPPAPAAERYGTIDHALAHPEQYGFAPHPADARDADHEAFMLATFGEDKVGRAIQRDRDRAALADTLGAARVAEDEGLVGLLPETERGVVQEQARDLRRRDPAAVAAAALLGRLEQQGR